MFSRNWVEHFWVDLYFVYLFNFCVNVVMIL